MDAFFTHASGRGEAVHVAGCDDLQRGLNVQNLRPRRFHEERHETQSSRSTHVCACVCVCVCVCVPQAVVCLAKASFFLIMQECLSISSFLQ
jgi:hypothetical protein